MLAASRHNVPVVVSDAQPQTSTTAIAPEACALQTILQECATLLATLPTSVFTASSRLLPGGTVGKHVRHLLDHVHAPIDALGTPNRVIDYDHRERDTAVESNLLVAIGVIDRLERRLDGLDESAAGQPVRVRAMLSAQGETVTRASTLGREIAFALHHALHHQAMLAAICREHGLAIDPSFGIAPSTAAHEAARHADSAPAPHAACRCGEC